MMLLKKIICKFIGHKAPTNSCGNPIVQISSAPINNYRYCWKILPCDRCITYSISMLYTEDEWQDYCRELAKEWADNTENQHIPEMVPPWETLH